MGIVFKNNAKTTLASNLSNSATSATVTDGSVFPTLGAGEFFLITFDDGTNNEICKCTARSSNTLTIVRAQDNTSARAFSSGDAAEGRVTAGVLETIQENIAAKSANQTVYNATTASSATAYNIGTDPGVEANAMVFLDGVMQHHDTFSFSGSTLTFDAAPVDGTKLEVIVDNLINLQSSNLTVDTFTAADVGGSAQTDFTLSDTPAAETNLIVFVEGVFQDQDAYTISSNTLSITTGVIAGRGVTVYVINPVNIGTPSDGTITSAKLSGNLTLPGTLTVGANDVAFDSPTFVVDNSNSRVGLGTASPTVPVDIVGEAKISSHLTILDAGSLKVGTGADLVISSDGTDGTIATLSSLTVDVASNIILDADGGQISFKDGGTEIGVLENSSSDFAIEAKVQDKDIKFLGNDNGSAVTALTLDMSEAGAASFNGFVGIGTTTLNKVFNIADPAQGGETLKLHFEANSSDDKWEIYGYDRTNSHYTNMSLGNSAIYIEDDKTVHIGGQYSYAAGASVLHLHQADATSNAYLHITQEDGGSAATDGMSIGMLDGGANAVVRLRENGWLKFYTNNTERWQIEAGGKFYGTGQIQGGTVILGGDQISYGGDNYSAIGTNSSSARFGYFRDFNASYPAMLFATDDNCHFSPHDTAVQVFFGSQGGDFGGNSSHNVRAASQYFMFNAGGSNGEFIFEVNGGNRGNITSSSSSGVFSDRDMKENIQDIDVGLTELLQLQPRRFKYKNGSHEIYGFIAQEVETAIPLAVGEVNLPEADPEANKTSLKTLDTTSLIAALVKSTQEQQVLIEALQKEVEELKGG